jgi:hypothetical protein
MIKNYRKILGEQHDRIEEYIQKLQNAFKEHIHYEEYILEQRDKQRPPNHIPIKTKLDKHIEDHKNIKKELEKLKQIFEKHILLFDTLHIHKL